MQYVRGTRLVYGITFGNYNKHHTQMAYYCFVHKLGPGLLE